MLTKHKIWLGAGVLAAAAGAMAGREPGFRMSFWPSHLGSVNSGAAGEAGGSRDASDEGGEAGERPDQAKGGEAGVGTTGVAGANATDESGEGGEHGTARSVRRAQDFAGGSFEAALAEVLGGEGGKGGLGISPLTETDGQWSFTVPALTGPQVNKAVSGNSLRSERHFALHFEPDGRYKGWSLSWGKAPMSNCPTPSAPNYGVFDAECWVAKENTLGGTWTVKDDTLCMSPAPRGVTEGRECVRAALMLNSLVFFGPNAQMIGKGAELVRGNNAARNRSS